MLSPDRLVFWFVTTFGVLALIASDPPPSLVLYSYLIGIGAVITVLLLCLIAVLGQPELNCDIEERDVFRPWEDTQ